MLSIAAALTPSSPVAATFLRASAGGGMARLSPPDCAITSSSESANTKPWLLVGLGNPGRIYRGTRHNVGFEMLDTIAESEGISIATTCFKALLGEGFISGMPVVLIKPQTFMNASGDSVAAVVSYFDIPINQVLVMYDDLDLPFASLRMRPKGGHGGHNGMRSIIEQFRGRTDKTRDFPRLRIGIGRPPEEMDPAHYVLRPFNSREHEELDFTFQTGLEAVRILVVEGFDKSATFVNSAKPSKILNS